MAGRVALEVGTLATGFGDEPRVAALDELRDVQRAIDELELSVLLGDDAKERPVAVLAEKTEPTRRRRRGEGRRRAGGGRRRDDRVCDRRPARRRAGACGGEENRASANRTLARALTPATASSAADTTTVSARATPSVPSVLSYHSLAV